jgi:hypothetical protein
MTFIYLLVDTAGWSSFFVAVDAAGFPARVGDRETESAKGAGVHPRLWFLCGGGVSCVGCRWRQLRDSERRVSRPVGTGVFAGNLDDARQRSEPCFVIKLIEWEVPQVSAGRTSPDDIVIRLKSFALLPCLLP